MRQAPAPHAPEHYRVLVVANETVGGAQLLETIRERIAGRDARVLVVCPALNSPLRHWASDEDDARKRPGAARREPEVDAGRGHPGGGEIGDGDPIQAIEDALRTFRPDELIVSTHPPG